MDSDYQHRKTQEALSQTAIVLGHLRAITGQPWVGYFERLEHALITGDIESAVRARGAIPIGGMGGFADFLESCPQIQSAQRELMELVGDLKLHVRYGVTRERQSRGS